MGFPPLPQGFSPLNNDQDAEPAPGADDSNFPPPPEGMTPVANSGAAETHMTELEFEGALRRKLLSGATGPEVADWARTIRLSDRENFMPVINNLRDVVRYRDEQSQGDVSPFANENPIQYVNPDDPRIAEAEARYRGNTRPEDDVQDNTATNFLVSAGSRPFQAMLGVGQLGSRAWDAVTGNDNVEARRNLYIESQGMDRFVHGDTAAGRAGALTGDALMTAPAPMGEVTALPRGLNVLATIARRAAGGAAIGALQPAGSDSAQNWNMVLSAVTAPALVPVAERVFRAVGGVGARAWMQIANTGVGQRIFDASGQLTRFGRVFRARLIGANPHLPPEFTDETLAALHAENARTVPADQHVIADTLARRENVRLTGGMRERDVGRVQNFEKAEMGEYGQRHQEAATNISRGIDEDVARNIGEINTTGETTPQAATNVATHIEANQAAADKAVSDRYDALRESNEHIDPDHVEGIVKDFIESLGGQADADTLHGSAVSYLQRLRNLVERGRARANPAPPAPAPSSSVPATGGRRTLPGRNSPAVSRAAVPVEAPTAPTTGFDRNENGYIRFGELWNLSRDLNAAARTATGSEAVDLGRVRTAVNNFLRDAPPEAFENGSNGVIRELADTNALNRQRMDTYGARDQHGLSGANIKDKAGSAIENIVAHVRGARSRGDPLNEGTIANFIFGSARNLTGPAATNAVQTVRQVIRAAPEAAQSLKAIVVNRMLDHMQSGLFERRINANQLQTRIGEIVTNNRRLLEAVGITPSEITRLQVNVYLHALKALPANAANNSGSGKWIGTAIGTLFRRSVAQLAGGAALMGNLPAAGAIGAVGVGSAVRRTGLVRRALSGRVARAPSTGGARAGQIGAATLVRQIQVPDDRDTGDNSQ